jgi:predicted lipid-binding transport protein (Tim44 family)
MNRFFLLLTLVIACFSLLATSAEARRFGGASSIGKQRSMSPQQTAKPSPAAPAASPAPIPQPAGNRWLGPLAGLAIGAGLGAMFAGGFGGMGGGFSSILMVVIAFFAVIFLVSIFRKRQPAIAYSNTGTSYAGAPEYASQPFMTGSAPASSVSITGNIPADFPVDAFLRSAKTSFIRLQDANDRKDFNDIREYTTPEMFAEISMQIRERDNSVQKTDVISINAVLLEVAHEGDFAIASVRMSGQLRENNGAPDSFDEIWHVQKNLKDENAVWLLSGIQQIV